MTIVPDGKDWTWVLSTPCPECGFDASAHPPRTVAAVLRANAGAWAELLARDSVGRRPNPAQWSALEYGCHVRDVLELAAVRIGLMRHEDEPRFPNWDQDATALESDYAAQDPRVVSGEIAAAASLVADLLDGLEGDEWDRSGRRGDGATFTVGSFAVYLLHDPVHHVWDVARGGEAGSGGEQG